MTRPYLFDEDTPELEAWLTSGATGQPASCDRYGECDRPAVTVRDCGRYGRVPCCRLCAEQHDDAPKWC